MKLLIIPVFAIVMLNIIGGCKSSSGPALFCDTTCLNDTIKFSGDHKLKPYVYISVSGCKADTIIWSYSGLGTNRKAGFADLLNTTVNINKNFVRCVFNDTSYAWLLFNDCITGRGYQLKLPFDKSMTIGRKSSGINNLDPKFNIDNSLVAYTDRGNIYVEEIATGNTAMMTFGEATEMDYDAIHETLDSVHVTPERIWVKVKLGDNWKEMEKKITLSKEK
jgi:hypothetical protein